MSSFELSTKENLTPILKPDRCLDVLCAIAETPISRSLFAPQWKVTRNGELILCKGWDLFIEKLKGTFSFLGFINRTDSKLVRYAVIQILLKAKKPAHLLTPADRSSINQAACNVGIDLNASVENKHPKAALFAEAVAAVTESLFNPDDTDHQIKAHEKVQQLYEKHQRTLKKLFKPPTLLNTHTITPLTERQPTPQDPASSQPQPQPQPQAQPQPEPNQLFPTLFTQGSVENSLERTHPEKRNDSDTCPEEQDPQEKPSHASTSDSDCSSHSNPDARTETLQHPSTTDLKAEKPKPEVIPTEAIPESDLSPNPPVTSRQNTTESPSTSTEPATKGKRGTRTSSTQSWWVLAGKIAAATLSAFALKGTIHTPYSTGISTIPLPIIPEPGSEKPVFGNSTDPARESKTSLFSGIIPTADPHSPLPHHNFLFDPSFQSRYGLDTPKELTPPGYFHDRRTVLLSTQQNNFTLPEVDCSLPPKLNISELNILIRNPAAACGYDVSYSPRVDASSNPCVLPNPDFLDRSKQAPNADSVVPYDNPYSEKSLSEIFSDWNRQCPLQEAPQQSSINNLDSRRIVFLNQSSNSNVTENCPSPDLLHSSVPMTNQLPKPVSPVVTQQPQPPATPLSTPSPFSASDQPGSNQESTTNPRGWRSVAAAGSLLALTAFSALPELRRQVKAKAAAEAEEAAAEAEKVKAAVVAGDRAAAAAAMSELKKIFDKSCAGFEEIALEIDQTKDSVSKEQMEALTKAFKETEKDFKFMKEAYASAASTGKIRADECEKTAQKLRVSIEIREYRAGLKECEKAEKTPKPLTDQMMCEVDSNESICEVDSNESIMELMNKVKAIEDEMMSICYALCDSEVIQNAARKKFLEVETKFHGIKRNFLKRTENLMK